MGFVFMSRILDNESVDNYIYLDVLANSLKANNCCRMKNEIFRRTSTTKYAKARFIGVSYSSPIWIQGDNATAPTILCDIASSCNDRTCKQCFLLFYFKLWLFYLKLWLFYLKLWLFYLKLLLF